LDGSKYFLNNSNSSYKIISKEIWYYSHCWVSFCEIYKIIVKARYLSKTQISKVITLIKILKDGSHYQKIPLLNLWADYTHFIARIIQFMERFVKKIWITFIWLWTFLLINVKAKSNWTLMSLFLIIGHKKSLCYQLTTFRMTRSYHKR
jgi:hypothetical protein